MSKVVQFNPRKPKPRPKAPARPASRNRQLLATAGALVLLVAGYLAIDRLLPARAAELPALSETGLG